VFSFIERGKMLSKSIALAALRRLPSRRLISTNSWAASALEKKGEKLEAGAPQPLIIVSSDVLNNPSDKVKKLAEELLNLNAMESLVLWRGIQVKHIFFSSMKHINCLFLL
jgi:predicted amidohydrolase YtcJ